MRKADIFLIQIRSPRELSAFRNFLAGQSHRRGSGGAVRCHLVEFAFGKWKKRAIRDCSGSLFSITQNMVAARSAASARALAAAASCCATAAVEACICASAPAR